MNRYFQRRISFSWSTQHLYLLDCRKQKHFKKLIWFTGETQNVPDCSADMAQSLTYTKAGNCSRLWCAVSVHVSCALGNAKGNGLLKNLLQLRNGRDSCKTYYLEWNQLLRHREERCHFSQNLLRFLSFLPVCLGHYAEMSMLHLSGDVYRHLPHSACLAVIQPNATSP